jgi:hypothetical protein
MAQNVFALSVHYSLLKFSRENNNKNYEKSLQSDFDLFARKIQSTINKRKKKRERET